MSIAGPRSVTVCVVATFTTAGNNRSARSAKLSGGALATAGAATGMTKAVANTAAIPNRVTDRRIDP